MSLGSGTDFKILYCKGSLNTNADALSHIPMLQTPCAVIMGLTHYSYPELRTAQLQDSTLSVALKVHQHSNEMPSDKKWRSPPLHRYRQLWKQLIVIEGVLCRQYSSPSPIIVTVPVLPAVFHREVLLRCHDAPTSGYLGVTKTLD